MGIDSFFLILSQRVDLIEPKARHHGVELLTRFALQLAVLLLPFAQRRDCCLQFGFHFDDFLLFLAKLQARATGFDPFVADAANCRQNGQTYANHEHNYETFHAALGLFVLSNV